MYIHIFLDFVWFRSEEILQEIYFISIYLKTENPKDDPVVAWDC
jgi:hypothetical protein